jgi:hypothetical protein
MTGIRIARRSSCVLLAALGGAFALAVPAHAATVATDLRPDLVVDGPLQSSTLVGPSFDSYSVQVNNNGVTGALSNEVQVTFQPVSRVYLNGQYYWVNMPGSSAIVGTGTAASLNGGGASESVSVHSSTAPAGYNRVTACVDSTNVVAESNESNNCRSEIVNMQSYLISG